MYMCSDRAPGIVYFGSWFGGGGWINIVHEAVCGKWFGVARLSGGLPCVITTLLVAASSGDTRQSGSCLGVLEEDGRVLS